jgi:hypothetical protein
MTAYAEAGMAELVARICHSQRGVYIPRTRASQPAPRFSFQGVRGAYKPESHGASTTAWARGKARPKAR